MSEEELKELLLSMGEKSFRAAQIFSWIHEKKAETFDDIPQARKQAIREAVMGDYYARLQAVKKAVDAMTITQREMFHRSLTETLALLSVGETKK